jgi:hypothetical protein
MKLDPGMHIGLHLVFFGKSGVTGRRGRVGGALGPRRRWEAPAGRAGGGRPWIRPAAEETRPGEKKMARVVMGGWVYFNADRWTLWLVVGMEESYKGR